MKFFLPLLGIVLLIVLVARYFLRQLTKETTPRYGDGNRIIPGSMQSSQPPPKPQPLITAAERAALTRQDDLLIEIEEPPKTPAKTKAQKLIGSKSDLKRAFLVRWLLDRYDK